ncbi:MAG: hypothetical protein WA655_05815 [Candidatus Korobacteraceae bacterium]
MRLNINLASQPYEAARQYRQRMTVLIAVLGLAAVVLVGYIAYQRVNSRDINRQIAAVQQQIDALDREEAQARAILNKPVNHGIADQSDFLNDLFARKAMSWTRIFTEMERIVPSNLHVVSMKPDYTKTNDLVLHMVVATDSRDKAVELVRRMEKSNHFRSPQVVAETVVANTTAQTAGSGDIQFDIAAVYIPGVQDEAPDTTEDKSAANANQGETAAAPAKAAGGASGSKPAARPNVNAAQNRPLTPNPGRVR